MQLILVAGIAYVAYKFFEIKDAAGKLQFKVSGIDLDTISASLAQTKLQAYLSVYNPSPVDLTFQHFTGTIYKQQTPVADISVLQPATIAAAGITQVPMTVVIRNAAALPLVLNGDLSGLTLQGTVTVSMIPIPVNLDLGNG